ncbi:MULTISPECIES: FGGY-family carbohydrate kinase [Haloferax]|uniref:FGGY family carbohydrate kinase n=2 Tax=Haloferax TaxID=2251 RepID=A0A871BL18_HALGI|nr:MULTISPECIES: FGGY-family carbohydrate kinase [Haloferax]QOS13496.1 FGGY family carbohydrate kinase [Haloferax gibbonsii]RDZ30340.1 carbohydrate kinase [Haloferax sp. Atlit-48N]RDZ34042.1 carbohydrate kinase [Haloferax sp. Atlit-24N]RLM33647.1 carbohydrate kinase [Haloferax sp. Atlit-109R]RLM40772.1 carbohydrate kinase [Haloferax sp. Atlit-105R]
MAQVIIGVDAGTTVIKSVAFSLDGEELHKSSVENAVDRPESGWAEQSMVTTWKKTAQTLSEVEDQLDDDDEVLALGVTGQGDGCWLVDEDGDPVRPAILWSDGRASSVVQAWQQSGVSERVYDICGGTQFPGSSLVILRWLKENEPERYEEADTVFYCKDWLKYKLTDELTTDPSDASLPYVESESAEYSDEVLDVVGMPEVGEMRPDLVPGTDVVGGLTRNAAVETGLPEGTPVVSGFIDIAASAFGSGAANPGDGSSIVGTTSVNQTVLDEAPDDDEQTGILLTLGVEGGLWTKFMSSMTGTPNLDWAIEEIMDKSSFNLVEEEVESIPVGSDGLIYHPFLSSAGERAPFLNPNARAQFMGLNQEHTQAHLVRAVYEGISLAMRDCFTHLPQNADEVYLSGGGANSDFWCQMFADCLNATIIIPEGTEFGAKGAALLAGVGTGAYDDLPSAASTTSSVAQSFEPRPKKVQQYSRWYDVYTDAYEATFAVWDERVEALEDLRYMSQSAGARPNKKTVVGKDTVKGGYDD